MNEYENNIGIFNGSSSFGLSKYFNVDKNPEWVSKRRKELFLRRILHILPLLGIIISVPVAIGLYTSVKYFSRYILDIKLRLLSDPLEKEMDEELKKAENSYKQYLQKQENNEGLSGQNLTQLDFGRKRKRKNRKVKKKSVYKYFKRNPGKTALGAGALGLGSFEAMRALQRYNLDREWPIENEERKKGEYKNMKSSPYHSEDLYIKERRKLQSPTYNIYTGFMNLFKRKKNQPSEQYGKRRRKKRKVKKRKKRKVKKRKKRKVKKIPTSLKKKCKRLKIRLTLKKGGKRIYKSEAMLKKQCKKADKRRKK